MHWKQWLQGYFYKGKTIGIYLLMVLIVFAGYTIFIDRLVLLPFIFSLIMLLTSYAVFTDMVAHLWYDDYDSNISEEEYIYKILHFRTHDLYGLAIFIISLIGLIATATINVDIGMVFISVTILIMLLIVNTRFYH